MSQELTSPTANRRAVTASSHDRHRPAVSVTMPAHNSERYIAQAIESILTQDFTDFELIIIDDGSTDSTPAIIARYAASDSRIRWRSRPNRGTVATRHELVEMCHGRYMAMLDSDDVALQGRLSKTVAYLESNPDCLAVGAAIEVIDGEGDTLCTWVQPLTHELIEAHMFEGTGLFMPTNTTTVRTEWILRVGAYDHTTITSAEDLDLLLRLAEHGRLTNLPDTLAQYRLHFANESMASQRRQVEQRNRIVELARARRGLKQSELPLALPTPESRLQTHIKWAWWALADGHHRTAIKHAKMAVRLAPWSPSVWRAYACAVRARLTEWHRRPKDPRS